MKNNEPKTVLMSIDAYESMEEEIEYLKSIKESRDDYKSGRVKSHDDIFGE